ncbi:GRAM domain-containing protein [Cohnella boryungensis]|uniref:GRAM domain-containing protein n=1 Tax=Cohnella boryungensis TaxID=768479 RepID=A0ABV8SC26_9BACL
MELRPTEQYILQNAAANLFRGIEGVGGRLDVTNERVIFRPHSLNIQTKILEIDLQEIVKVEKRNTMFVVPNGMKICVTSGKEYKFVVWGRTKLIEQIRNARNHATAKR